MQIKQETRPALMQKVIETYKANGYLELKDFPGEYVLMYRDEDGAKVRIGYHNGYGGTGCWNTAKTSMACPAVIVRAAGILFFESKEMLMKMRTLTVLGLVMATTVSGCAVTSGSVRQQAQLCPGNWTATGHILSGYEFELSRPIAVDKREALTRIGEFIKDDPESDTLYIRTFLPENDVMRAELPVLNNPARYSLVESPAGPR